MSKYKIEYHKLFVVLKNIKSRDRLQLPRLLKRFEVSKSFTRKGGKGGRKTITMEAKPAKFYSKTLNNDEVRLFINYSRSLLVWLTSLGYTNDDIKLEEVPMHKMDTVKVKMNPKFKPRDYQKPYIDWILSTTYPNLLELKPGDGKTFMGTYASVKLKHRTVIIVRAMWVQKWFTDLQELTNCKPDDILTIAGAAKLNTAIENFKSRDFKHKFIIISNKTMQRFITTYENTLDVDNEWEYACYPEEYMKVFRAGTLLIDEGHLDFNLNYKILCYTDADKLIYMTGTYDSDNPTTRKIEETLFPADQRMAARKRDKFLYVTAVSYHFPDYVTIPSYAHSTSQGYNHIKYEMFLFQRPFLLVDYSKMIMSYVNSHYMDVREPGDKCMVYASSIPMCTYLTYVFKHYYKDLKVARYVEDDPYENVLDNDLIVSTVLSSGTAFDIPQLITVIQTIAISSSQANKQNSGRLRRLKDKKVRFVYFYTPRIDKHMHYHYKRRGILSEEAISYETVNYGKLLGTTYPKLHKNDYIESIPETIYGAYAMYKYIVKTYPGVISKLNKEIEANSGTGDPTIKWKRKSIISKQNKLKEAETQLEILEPLFNLI